VTGTATTRRRSAAAAGTGRAARRSALYAVMILIAAVLTSPFLWLVITALKSDRSLGAFPVQWTPHPVEFGNFGRAVRFLPFFGYLRNSLTIAAIQSVLMTLASAYVGFGFARLRGRGKKAMFTVVMATMMLPHITTLIPAYAIFTKVHLLNSYVPWVLWGLSGSAFLIFMFRQFFAGLPTEIEEAALLDGLGYFRIFFLIFLPQAKPMLATGLILSFNWAWNDFFTPMLLLSHDRTTLAVALATDYTDPQGNPVDNLMAAGAVLYVLPVMALFLVLQRYYRAGSATSGLK
jgi:multiple sugar transport system permease protein